MIARADSEGDATSASASLQTWGSDYLTLCRAAPARSRAAKRSAFAWRRRSGQVSMGVLYILDEPSIGLHQRDNDKLLAHAQKAARSRQHADRGGARRGNDACTPTTSSTSARARACTAARSSAPGTPEEIMANARIPSPGSTCPANAEDPGSGNAAEPKRLAHRARRAGEQPEEHRRDDSRWACSPA